MIDHVRQSDAWEEDMPMELIDDVKAGSTTGKLTQLTYVTKGVPCSFNCI